MFGVFELLSWSDFQRLSIWNIVGFLLWVALITMTFGTLIVAGNVTLPVTLSPISDAISVNATPVLPVEGVIKCWKACT